MNLLFLISAVAVTATTVAYNSACDILSLTILSSEDYVVLPSSLQNLAKNIHDKTEIEFFYHQLDEYSDCIDALDVSLNMYYMQHLLDDKGASSNDVRQAAADITTAFNQVEATDDAAIVRLKLLWSKFV
jgi:hypothetical protein